MTTFTFESSGKVKHATPNELAEADKNSYILGFVHGKTEDGGPYYAYVAIKPSKYREFYEMTAAKKAMVIGDYGTVVAAGFEFDPPPEVVQEMRETYGFDDQFEEKLKQETLKQQEVWFKKQEETHINDIVAMLQKKSSDKA